MTGVLIKRGKLDTDMHKGRMPGEDESKVWDEVSISQGTPKFTGNPESQERAMFIPSSWTTSLQNQEPINSCS